MLRTYYIIVVQRYRICKSFFPLIATETRTVRALIFFFCKSALIPVRWFPRELFEQVHQINKFLRISNNIEANREAMVSHGTCRNAHASKYLRVQWVPWFQGNFNWKLFSSLSFFHSFLKTESRSVIFELVHYVTPTVGVAQCVTIRGVLSFPFSFSALDKMGKLWCMEKKETVFRLISSCLLGHSLYDCGMFRVRLDKCK